MNISYLIYEAERPRSIAEQREADVRAGEFAAAVARVGNLFRRTAGKQEPRPGGQRPTVTALSCAVPRPR